MKTQLIAIILICSCLLVSCSNSYQKLLKSTDYDLKFEKAKEFYNNGKYSKAIPLFEELIGVYKGTKSLEKIYYYFAYSLYAQKDFLLSEFYFKNFHSFYPKSVFAEDALFMVAYCNYQLSPKDRLDQSYTGKAMDQFQIFINTYPYSEQVEEANLLIEEMRDKLEIKDFNSAKLYYDLQHYKASAVAFENLLKNYPDTELREEAMYYIVKSNYDYAINSIDSKQEERFRKTIDMYYDFVDKFENSKYLRETEKIFTQSENYIKKINN